MSSGNSAVARFVKGHLPGRRLWDGYVDPDKDNEIPRSVNIQNVNVDFPSSGMDFEMTAATVTGVGLDDTYTLDEAVNALGFGRFQIKLSLVTGLCWMADSMEMMILSILSPALQCDWGISDVQVASITTVVFTGMMLSSPFWGKFSDKFGRKTTLLVGGILLAYYGLLSAFAPTYIWILLLRGVVGFGMGSVPQGVTLYSEFVPTSQRGRCVILMDSFWALGACMEVLLALFVMPTLGWHWLLGLSAIPLIIFLMISVWLPESARFHAVNGHYEKALEIIHQIASENGKAMPPGRLLVEDAQNIEKGRIRDLLIPDLRKTTCLLWYIWFSCAFCYYGIVLMTTELFQLGDTCHESHSEMKISCAIACKPLTTSDYTDMLWTTLAEFPGMLLTLLLIDKFGRKKTMAGESLLFSFLVFLLFICGLPRSALTIMLFVARGAISGVFNSVYVYTPEFYPTTLRAVGVGMCSGIARLGAMSTPFIAQVVLKYSVRLALPVYGIVGLLACVAALLLPIETKDRHMQEVHRSTS